jgi:ABC-type phosphonate transport system ATPase subunit
VLDAKYRTLARVSIGVVRNAHLNILRSKISARTNVAVPPCSCMRVGPKHPKIVLPYSKHVIARACTN